MQATFKEECWSMEASRGRVWMRLKTSSTGTWHSQASAVERDQVLGTSVLDPLSAMERSNWEAGNSADVVQVK